jgi:hypothetical protein
MSQGVQDGLAMLVSLDRPALAERWEEVFGSPAPVGCRSGFLRSALGWHLQAQALHPKRSWDRLLRLQRPPAETLTPGTRLVREWQGATHQVMVLPSGFEYGGRPYRSLSAIARAITGTAWSGPAFFGLR